MHDRLTVLAGAFCGLSLVFAAVVTHGQEYAIGGAALQGLVIARPQQVQRWRTINEPEVLSGATIPAGINTFFHIPGVVETISREILLGNRGTVTRYWGYCLPSEDDPRNPPQTVGFPGKLFLSEAERQWRAGQELLHGAPTPFRPPRNHKQLFDSSVIRHQMEEFVGGMTCYIMTEHELALGDDVDDDGVNIQMEKKFLTDPWNPDTDGDGLDDGKEVLLLGTDPLRRDTDGDGLIDGMEDTNLNGYVSTDETDPRTRDTDKDGLCDGYCREYETRRTCKDNAGSDCINLPFGQWRGEDKNLNGKVDAMESSPLKIDSDGDGIWDEQDFFRCLLDKKTNC